MAAAAASAVLMLAIYPPAEQSEAIWIAAVPLILLARYAGPKRAFWFGWLGGSIHWICSLTWMMALTHNGGPWPLVVLGQGALGIYMGLYWGLFAYAVALIRERCLTPWPRLAGCLVEPFLWVGCEWLRSNLMGGFPWNLLGTAAAGMPNQLALIQVASLGGVYAVSFLLLAANSAAASFLERLCEPLIANLQNRPRVKRSYVRLAEVLIPCLMLLAAFKFGAVQIQQFRTQERTLPFVTAALIQPNSPCIFSILSGSISEKRELLIEQTETAALIAPDLVIWPETPLFGALPVNAGARDLTRAGAYAARATLLTGALWHDYKVRPPRVHNSAVAFTTNGMVSAVYHKRHLVPFGEFVPFDKTIPWLQRFVPAGESCWPGKDVVVLTVPTKTEAIVVGPLICYEDTHPALARDAANAGAQLLVNLTNDNWFNGSIEPFQHFRQSILRAVETGLPLLRAANSGVSGYISPIGTTGMLTDDRKTDGFAGFHIATFPRLPGSISGRTIYAKYGDWTLALPCVLFLLAVVGCRPIRFCVSRIRNRA